MILNIDPYSDADDFVTYGLISSTEKDVVHYQLPGERTTNLLLHLLKMKITHSQNSRNKFTEFLKRNTSYNILSKQWGELGKTSENQSSYLL